MIKPECNQYDMYIINYDMILLGLTTQFRRNYNTITQSRHSHMQIRYKSGKYYSFKFTPVNLIFFLTFFYKNAINLDVRNNNINSIYNIPKLDLLFLPPWKRTIALF